jgi:tetratricopeptide (TPR) repeat protein
VNIAARLEGIAEPGGICISSAVYDYVRGKAGVEFVDLGELNLKNIARPVRAYTVVPNGPSSATQDERGRLAPLSPPRLSIVVLPFTNLSGDPDQDYFVDGVTESLTTDLSRISGSFVIGRHTAFTYKGKAVDLPRALTCLGMVHIYTARAAQGIIECERALALDGNLAMAHAAIGMAKNLLGRGEETEAHIQEALRLSPRDIVAHRWMFFAGAAKLFHCDDVEAVAWLRRSIEANRNFPMAHFLLAAALALLGSLDEAEAVAKAGLTLDPGFTIRRFRTNAVSDNPNYLCRARTRL